MNIRELMGKLAYKNCNTAELAEALGLSKTSVYRKLSGQSDFTCTEIGKLKSRLDLSGDDLVNIFFTEM